MSVSSTVPRHGEAEELQAQLPPFSKSSFLPEPRKRVMLEVNDRGASALHASLTDLASKESASGVAANMRRMGKEQDLVRSFRQTSVASSQPLALVLGSLASSLLAQH